MGAFNLPTLKLLTKDKPLVFHFNNKNDCRGGVTVVFDPKLKAFGVAACSYRDNYSRKRGIAICKGRLETQRGAKRSFKGRTFFVFAPYDPAELTFDNVHHEAQRLAEEAADVVSEVAPQKKR